MAYQRQRNGQYLAAPRTSREEIGSISDTISDWSSIPKDVWSQHDQSTLLSSMHPTDDSAGLYGTKTAEHRYQDQTSEAAMLSYVSQGTSGNATYDPSLSYNLGTLTSPAQPAQYDDSGHLAYVGYLGNDHGYSQSDTNYELLGPDSTPLCNDTAGYDLLVSEYGTSILQTDLYPRQVNSRNSHQQWAQPSSGISFRDPRVLADKDEPHRIGDALEASPQTRFRTQQDAVDSAAAGHGSRVISGAARSMISDGTQRPAMTSATIASPANVSGEQGKRSRLKRKAVVTYDDLPNDNRRSRHHHTTGRHAPCRVSLGVGVDKMCEGWLEKRQAQSLGPPVVTQEDLVALAKFTNTQPQQIRDWFIARSVVIANEVDGQSTGPEVGAVAALDEGAKREKDYRDIEQFLRECQHKECPNKDGPVGLYRCRRKGCTSSFANFETYRRHQLDKFHDNFYRCRICGRIGGRHTREHIVDELDKKRKKDPMAYPLRWQKYRELLDYDPGRCTFSCEMNNCRHRFEGKRMEAWDALQHHQWNKHIVPDGNAAASNRRHAPGHGISYQQGNRSDPMSSASQTQHDADLLSGTAVDRLAARDPSLQRSPSMQGRDHGTPATMHPSVAEVSPNFVACLANRHDRDDHDVTRLYVDAGPRVASKATSIRKPAKVDGNTNLSQSLRSSTSINSILTAQQLIPEAPSPSLSATDTSFDDVIGRHAQSSDSEPYESSREHLPCQPDDFEDMTCTDRAARSNSRKSRSVRCPRATRARSRTFRSDFHQMQAIHDRLNGEADLEAGLAAPHHNDGLPIQRTSSPAPLQTGPTRLLNHRLRQQVSELTQTRPARLNSLDSEMEGMSKTIENLEW